MVQARERRLSVFNFIIIIIIIKEVYGRQRTHYRKEALT